MARKTQRQKNAEYQKERNRVQKLYTSFKRRGYIDTKDLLTDSLGFFNIPTLTQVSKKATQAMVNALKKITPDWMYKKFAYSDPRTGETVKLSCAIGDEYIDGKPYKFIVEEARKYIEQIGGFEKFAEWGLF